MNDRCQKCGAQWEAHEFSVPAPYCPNTYETIESELVATNQKLEAAENRIHELENKNGK